MHCFVPLVELSRSLKNRVAASRRALTSQPFVRQTPPMSKKMVAMGLVKRLSSHSSSYDPAHAATCVPVNPSRYHVARALAGRACHLLSRNTHKRA